MNPRIRLFLDVDGVINADLARLRWSGGQAQGHAAGYRIRWAPEMVTALAGLPLELHWCTTWREMAPGSIGGLIGWGNPGYVVHPNLDPRHPTSFPSIDWKIDAVHRIHARSPLPFIHVDDELANTHENHVREYHEWVVEAGGLAIGPDMQYGIEPKHIETMRRYIERVTEEDEGNADG